MPVHHTDTHLHHLHPNHGSLHLHVITNTHAGPVGASCEPHRIQLPKPEEQDGFGLQAVSSHRSESAPRSPACPGEPGRAEHGISKGRWCPLLSQKNIGAAENTSGTCHPGRGAGHPPLWAAGVGTGLSLAAPTEQPGLTAIRAQWVWLWV